MQNDIVRQPPQNQESQSEVVEQSMPEPAQVMGEAPLAEIEATPPEQPAAEITQLAKSSGAPVGVIVVALMVCAILCSAVVYATFQAQN